MDDLDGALGPELEYLDWYQLLSKTQIRRMRDAAKANFTYIPVRAKIDNEFRWRRRKDGRWTLRITCPDGTIRLLVAQRGEPLPAGSRETRSLRVGGVPAQARFTVLERDGFRCQYCGATPARASLWVDHIVPVVEGGSDDLANLITACQTCNIGKGTRLSTATRIATFDDEGAA